MSNPSVLAGADVGLSGFGGILSAMGTFTDASAAKNAAKQNAAFSEYQAADAERRGQLELQKVQRNAAQVKGAQRADMAARGLDLTDGSPLDVLTDTDYYAALDANTTKENTAREVYGFRVQGANYAAQARAINPWLSAGASALASAGAVASKWYQYKKGGVTPDILGPRPGKRS